MTYNSRYLTLNLTLYSAGNMGDIDPQISMTYSVDGKYNGSVPLEVSNPGLHVVTNAIGFVNLPKLSEGSHCLTIYLYGHNQKSLNPKYLSYADTVYFSISADASDVPPPGWVPQKIIPQDVQPPGIDEKALTYIENVLPLDFTHYTITNTSYELPGLPNSAHRDEAVTFTLNSSDSMLVVNCQFWDGVQYTCDLRVQRGSPVYVKDCSNLLEMTRALVEGHQAQTGINCSYLLDMLKLVTTTENTTTVTSGNIKLVVYNGHVPMGGLAMVNGTLHMQPVETLLVTSFHWTCNVNGEEQTVFFMNFDSGHLNSLRDERIYSNVSVSPGKPELEPDASATPSATSLAPGVTPSASNLDNSKNEELQSQPTAFPLALVAAASAVGIAAVCVSGIVFHKRRDSSKKSTLSSVDPNAAS